MGTAYYNEIDPFAAAWLRELISAGHIAPGDVDERSIEDVRPDDLRPYMQCHFFAGIGVWSHALRCAGWADDRPVWTGSCPCQPFSAAGKGGGFADERHLWPHFHHLIRECGPDVVFGEQVASKDGLAWFDLVQADLEGTGYAAGAVDLCAAGVGAPHIRQRLWWVGERLADANGRDPSAERQQPGREQRQQPEDRGTGLVADPLRDGAGDRSGQGVGSETEIDGGDGCLSGQRLRSRIEGSSDGLADADQQQRDRSGGAGTSGRGEPANDRAVDRPGPTNGLWRDADWLFCRDGKWRPVEPGTFPLVNGAPARVGRLRGYGNAIVAEAAVAFIEAYQQA